ncbi:MAG TPA: methyltransferase domain-containing protein [Acidimicrobiia bacterium]|nr:methyltransferase domain-containing protein [Acidimicrobiia bacterium]
MRGESRVSQISFDEETSRRLERLYRTRDALRRRRLVREAIAADTGDRVLDVGCGSGFYVAELLDTIGPSGAIVGVDSSAAMLGLAAARCAGHDNVVFREGDALALPVESESFDVVFSVQVLEYVADATAALAEMRRSLRPGGRVVVWDVDWATVSWHSSDDARMDRVLRAWDEHLAHPSLPRTLASRMRSAGFDGITSQGHVFASTAFDPETYGVAMIPLIADFVSGRESITAEEAAAWSADQEDLGQRGDYYFSCTQFCFRGTA